MANVNFNYEEAIDGIRGEVARMSELLDKEAGKALDEIGKVIESNVMMTAPVSDKEYYYYRNGKGGTGKKRNVHIADDVTRKVKKSKKSKMKYVSVSGDKDTWRKWHLANDGHVAKNGKFIPGNNFADKAEIMSEDSIDRIVEKAMEGVVKN